MSALMLLVGVLAADPTPRDKDVVAGPIALVIFVALAVAVGLLGWSLRNHLNRAGRSRDEGLLPSDREPRD